MLGYLTLACLGLMVVNTITQLIDTLLLQNRIQQRFSAWAQAKLAA